MEFDLNQLVGNLAFPCVICLFLLKFVNTTQRQTNQLLQDLTKRLGVIESILKGIKHEKD